VQPIVGVGAVVVHEGRLLMIRRGNDPFAGTWSVPGGRLEFGETLQEGALRELQEETGLVGRVSGPCGIAERISAHGHIVLHDYRIQVEGDLQPTAGDDAEDAAWLTRSQLLDRPLVPQLLDFLVEHGVWDELDD
jgi:ADP-ribose pyrophosphatase YjhB (NUDIX family)